MPAVPLAPPPSKVDVAYELTRDAILGGLLQPRERIQLNDIAAAAGCSRTPALSAVDRLARDGLVVKRDYGAQGSFYVAEVTGSEADEAREALAVLLDVVADASDGEVLAAAIDALDTAPACRDTARINAIRAACLAVAEGSSNRACALVVKRSLETLLFRCTRGTADNGSEAAK
ncbi:GntR family transcriptional regulator [Curtobacterium sp. 20TX0008]|uniref:GntR family transcriptional regulator n=1 Tax=Curtobacterium sp. 20TX0008 TaxID=3022018 RepID=UPI0023303BBA|nr:GntR family transcriptional regulator [Curtobacterium sp. 20TX0008]MDB6425930.1 GntR family transcriptional regulator [Curtobacterium sp. 20TX0008]